MLLVEVLSFQHMNLWGTHSNHCTLHNLLFKDHVARISVLYSQRQMWCEEWGSVSGTKLQLWQSQFQGHRLLTPCCVSTTKTKPQQTKSIGPEYKNNKGIQRAQGKTKAGPEQRNAFKVRNHFQNIHIDPKLMSFVVLASAGCLVPSPSCT